MKNISRILILLLTADLVYFFVLVAREICVNTLSSANLLKYTPTVAVAGVLVALITWIWNIRRQANEDWLKESKDYFAKAYETLDVLNSDGLPENDRNRWLTCARLLSAAQAIGKRIDSNPYKELFIEAEQFWRFKFYDLTLDKDDKYTEDYYAQKLEHLLSFGEGDRAPLDKKSLAVIYRFVKWPDDLEDKLAAVEPFSAEEVDKMRNFGPKLLGNLLNKYNKKFKSSNK
jgi:hypothetical protein